MEHQLQDAWELREPTDDDPDVGLNWLVRNTPALLWRTGEPNVKAIGRLAGLQPSMFHAMIPKRRDKADFRTASELFMRRLTLVGVVANGVPADVAHSKLFRLPVSQEAVAELEARLAELNAPSERVAA